MQIPVTSDHWIEFCNDPALTDIPTLVFQGKRHEWFFWIENRWPKFLHYRDGNYVKGKYRE